MPAGKRIATWPETATSRHSKAGCCIAPPHPFVRRERIYTDRRPRCGRPIGDELPRNDGRLDIGRLDDGLHLHHRTIDATAPRGPFQRRIGASPIRLRFIGALASRCETWHSAVRAMRLSGNSRRGTIPSYGMVASPFRGRPWPNRSTPINDWLGIPPTEQPANHYRLLGIALFEDGPSVIEHAADRQMAHLRTFQSGKHAAASQKLLNEWPRPRSACCIRARRPLTMRSSVRRARRSNVNWPSTNCWKSWRRGMGVVLAGPAYRVGPDRGREGVCRKDCSRTRRPWPASSAR